MFPKLRKDVGVFGLFCIINRYFESRIRIRCIELYMGTWFKHFFDIFRDCFKKRHRSVNSFRTDHFVRDVFGFGVLNGLTSLKYPSEGGIASLKHPS